MHNLEMPVAESVVRLIGDRQNPSAASEALRLIDKWLFEHDQGLLNMTPDVRALLDSSLTS